MDSSKIIVLLFGILYVGFIIYTRKGGNFKEFSVANRNIGNFLIFATICATYIGPASTLGLSRDGATNGYSLIVLSSIASLGLLTGGYFFAGKIRSKFSDALSIGDVIAGPKSHNHKLVKLAVGFFSFLMIGSIFIVMSYAGGELINNIFGFPKIWSVAIMTTIVVLYSSFGGIRATIQTDAIQFINFIIIIPLLAVLICFRDDFSFSSYMAQSSAKASPVLENMSGLAIISTLFYWFISSSGLDPALVSRFLSSENPKTARKGPMMAAVFLLFWTWLMVFIGDAGQMMVPGLEASDQSLLEIAKYFLPDILFGIFVIAMIGVVMSSQDSALNTSCILFSEDIAAGIKSNLGDKQKLIIARLVTVILGFLAVLLCNYLNSVLHAVIFILEHSTTILLPVTIFSVLIHKPNWRVALPTMFGGLLAQVLWEIFSKSDISGLIIGLSSGVVIYLILHWALPNQTIAESKGGY